MSNGYDNVSFFYDRLSRLVFGNKLHTAQCHFLAAIMPADHILIVGGGSGQLLNDITKLHPRDLNITYIDASQGMIALAKQRDTGDNKVSFITGQVQHITLSSDYDIIITAFLFDNFAEETAAAIFRHLDSALHTNGRWLYTDFANSHHSTYRLVLKIMYLFFRKLCGIQASQLPDMNKVFSQCGYTQLREQKFMSDFVITREYAKNVQKK